MLYKYYFEKELSSTGLHQKLASKLNVFLLKISGLPLNQTKLFESKYRNTKCINLSFLVAINYSKEDFKECYEVAGVKVILE